MTPCAHDKSHAGAGTRHADAMAELSGLITSNRTTAHPVGCDQRMIDW
ncbi:MAG: hypothetical protein JO214_19095 [Frankiaceae bacterium]|nr:hypothetical protein [Frankiaceae bacterium]